MKTIGVLIACVVMTSLVNIAWSQSSDEAAGRAAEQTGNYQEALTQYLSAIQRTSEGSAEEQRLLQAAIKVAQRITPAPPIPQEAMRFSIKGQTWMKQAKSEIDFGKAAKEFANAARIAPWWGDAHYNRGVVLEKAGEYEDAIASYKLYMLASPRAGDLHEVQRHIYALEVQEENNPASPKRLGTGIWYVWMMFANTHKAVSDAYLPTTSLRFSGKQLSFECWWPGRENVGAMKCSGVLSGRSLSGDCTLFGIEQDRQVATRGTFRGEVSADGRTINYDVRKSDDPREWGVYYRLRR